MANQNSTPTPIVEQLPKVKKITGELLAVSELDGQEITLLSIQTMDEEVITISTSSKYWRKAGKPYSCGSILQVQYEERIGNKTTYDDNGEVKLHKNSGNALSAVNPYSTFAWNKALTEQKRNEDLAILMQQDPATMGAIGSYLAATFGK